MIKSDLKYNISALREFKELSGVSPFELTNEQILDPDNFGALAYVGLKNGKYANSNEMPDRQEIEKELSLKDTKVVWESFAYWCNLSSEEDTEKK